MILYIMTIIYHSVYTTKKPAYAGFKINYFLLKRLTISLKVSESFEVNELAG